jgi:hypothetical protein
VKPYWDRGWRWWALVAGLVLVYGAALAGLAWWAVSQ